MKHADRYLKGFAIKCGSSLFHYVDGHYSYYEPDRIIYPSTVHYNASEAMRALNYALKDGKLGAEIVRIRLVYESVDMNDLTNEFNKDRIKKLSETLTTDDIKFIKEHM